MRSKRVIALLVAIAALITFASGAFAANYWTDEGNYDTSWYNATDKTFTLTTAKELAGLAYILNANNNSRFSDEMFDGKTILLGADIDISANEWVPIGGWVYGKPAQQIYFKGTFDGQGHKITGLNISTIKSDTLWVDSGIGFFSEPGKGNTEPGDPAIVKNLYIEGSVVPSAYSVPDDANNTGAWKFAGILSGSSVNLNSLNVVVSGDVFANATNAAYAGLYIANQYGGKARNVVAYGTVRANANSGYSYAGGVTGYGNNKSSALAHDMPTTFTNCVSLASSVLNLQASSAAAGITMGLVSSSATNCAWLTGDGLPTSAGTVDASPTNKGIAREGEVKVTAVMLATKALKEEHYTNEDTVIPLEFYPATASSDDITATWTFDDESVEVKSAKNGFATVSSAATGAKKFTVVVKGLNGFEADDSVTLKGEIKFSEKNADAASENQSSVAVTKDDVSTENTTAEIKEVETVNTRVDLAGVEDKTRELFDVISGKLDESSQLTDIKSISVKSTLRVSIDHSDKTADVLQEPDITLTIKFDYTPTPGKSLVALIKPNGGTKYDAFSATFAEGTLKIVVKNFRDYFSEKYIAIAELEAEAMTTSDGSSSGACTTGAAAAFAAALVIFRKKKQR